MTYVRKTLFLFLIVSVVWTNTTIGQKINAGYLHLIDTSFQILEHHPALAQLDSLLEIACEALGVTPAAYRVEIIQKVDGTAYLNARVYRSQNRIQFGLEMVRALGPYPEYLLFVMLHEVGHTTHGWVNGFPEFVPVSEEDELFIRRFNHGQLVELASDREAIGGMYYLGYSASSTINAIQVINKIMRTDFDAVSWTHPSASQRIEQALILEGARSK